MGMDTLDYSQSANQASRLYNSGFPLTPSYTSVAYYLLRTYLILASASFIGRWRTRRRQNWRGLGRWNRETRGRLVGFVVGDRAARREAAPPVWCTPHLSPLLAGIPTKVSKKTSDSKIHLTRPAPPGKLHQWLEALRSSGKTDTSVMLLRTVWTDFPACAAV